MEEDRQIREGGDGVGGGAMRSAAMGAYSLGLLLTLVVGAPVWGVRMLFHGRYRAGLRERLGGVSAGVREAAGAREVVWVHAVSVGEVLAVAGVVEELRRARPELAVAVSTTTATGQALARTRFPGLAVFYLPLDFGYAVRRVLRVLRPRMVVLVESELWPRLLWECARAEVPVAVANARMSDRSFGRAMRVRAVWRPVLAGVARFLAQGEETAGRLRALGVAASKVVVTGNLKFDVRAQGETAMVGELRRRLPEGARVLVCGSTLDGEEALLLEAWPEIRRRVPAAVMVLAPRHPQRFAAVARMLEERGLPFMRASALGESERIGVGAVVLLDTIGDLAGVYALGAAAFVGGSLVEAGGHNPLEPARFAVPVMVGDSVYNFREIAEAMRAEGGLRTVERGGLAEAVAAVLGGGEEARAMGERGRAVFQERAGATGRTAAALLSMLAGEGRP